MMRSPLLLLLSLVLLTGCAALSPAPEEDDEDWQEYQQSQEEPSGHEDAAPELPSAFSMAYHKDQTLDPITCGDGIQQQIASLLYEPLVQLDQHFTPQPLLCSGWSWNDTGLVCTIDILDGVCFSDGTPLTAHDVAATLRRAAQSPRYGYRLRNIVSIASNRSNQVVITLAAPDRGLPALLNIPIVKRGTESHLAPVGSGPYVFITGADGDYLSASEEWWQQKPLPTAAIPLIHAKDRDAAMYLFSSHRIELLAADPTADLISVIGPSQTAEQPTTIFQFIGFNTLSGPFAQQQYRSAFSRGLQRGMLSGAFLSGHATPAQFPISPLSLLYPEDLEQDYSKDSSQRPAPQGEDPQEDQPLRFLVNEEDTFRQSAAQFIVGTLADAGWDIQLQVLPWEDYMAVLAAGDFDLYYGQVRLTPDWDLRDLLGTGGTLNYGGWTNPDTDALLAAFAAAEDQSAAARNLCMHLQRTAPIAPICFQNYTVLSHVGVVEGLQPAPENIFRGIDRWSVHLAPQ